MRVMWARYRNALSGIEGLTLIDTARDEPDTWVPWFHDVYVTGGATSRDALAAFLKWHRVQTRPMYPALSTMPAHARTLNRSLDNPHARWAAEHGLFLPSATSYSDEQVDLVTGLIRLHLQQQGM